MGEKLGAEVDLDKVPLKYAGLRYTEIWISEAQERMVLAVPPENLDAILKLFAAENVEATVIGRFTDDKQLRLRYNGQQVGELDMEFLHDGVPQVPRGRPSGQQPRAQRADAAGEGQLQRRPADDPVVLQRRQQGMGHPPVRPRGAGRLAWSSRWSAWPTTAPATPPCSGRCWTRSAGVAISCGMNPLYGDLDPYWMALAGIDEAIRNLICVGGRLDRIALLDNFCWGNCDQAGDPGHPRAGGAGLLRRRHGLPAPFISGKDSLNNEFVCEDGTVIRIPPTLLISAMSLVDDVDKCVTMDLKKPGNLLFIVGRTNNELGGSHYYKIHGALGANVPRLDLDLAPRIAQQARRRPSPRDWSQAATTAPRAAWRWLWRRWRLPAAWASRRTCAGCPGAGTARGRMRSCSANPTAATSSR